MVLNHSFRYALPQHPELNNPVHFKTYFLRVNSAADGKVFYRRFEDGNQNIIVGRIGTKVNVVSQAVSEDVCEFAGGACGGKNEYWVHLSAVGGRGAFINKLMPPDTKKIVTNI